MKKYQIVAVLLLLMMPLMGFAQKVKVKAKKVVGDWEVVKLNGERLPEGLEMGIEFTKEGELILNMNGERIQNVRWEVNAEKTGLDVSMEDAETDGWEIGKLTKTEMLIVDKTDELTLRRKGAKVKEKKVKKKKLKASAKKIVGRWKAVRFNGEELPNDIEIFMELDKDGAIRMETMGEEEMSGKWSLNEERTALQILGDDGSEEVWELLVMNKKSMEILSANITIELIKEDKK